MEYKIVTHPMILNGEVPVGTRVMVVVGDNLPEYGNIKHSGPEYISVGMDSGEEEDFMCNGFSETTYDEERSYTKIYKFVGDEIIPTSEFDELVVELEVGDKMTVRDEFASRVIVGLMGRNWESYDGRDSDLIGTWVRSAYGIADKMMKFRKENPQNKVD